MHEKLGREALDNTTLDLRRKRLRAWEKPTQPVRRKEWHVARQGRATRSVLSHMCVCV